MIHKTAIVNSKAKISDNVEIGPYCIIGPEVEIGTNSVIHSHVNIVGNTKIGENNKIYPFSSIGTPPQDLKYKGEKNLLVIGNNNKLVFLMTIEKARFRNPVIPDCILELNIEAIRSHGRVWKYKGIAYVGDKKMADAQWSATIVDRK